MRVARDGSPSYLRLGAAELAVRVEQALTLLGEQRCTVCPRLCKVGRLLDHRGLCAIGRQAVVASYFPHFGEEDCLRGRNGSGTIFFSGCNLRCVFCQNHDISWQVRGERVTPARLAQMMLELQARGCHNINWVTPEHVVPQILEAVPPAVAGGLRLPIVYNTSAYDSPDSLRLLEGIVDVYMPDFKVWTRQAARRYLRRPEYAQVAQETVREMHRQVGPLELDGDGLARRGLLLRHLVMPGMLQETEAILGGVLAALGLIYALGYSATAWILGRSILRAPTAWIVAFLVGWAILRVVVLIPVLGGLVWFAAVVFGLGTLVVAVWRGRSAARTVPAAG